MFFRDVASWPNRSPVRVADLEPRSRMVEVITCPGCRRTLQVPEQYLGQTVQCPECRHMFTAASSAVSANPPPATSVPGEKPKPRRDDDDDFDDLPRRRRRYEDDDDDDLDLRRRRRALERDYAPHRGGVILALGLFSLVGGMSLMGLPLVLGPVAWALGAYDLHEIREGRMDPAGESMTRTEI